MYNDTRHVYHVMSRICHLCISSRGLWFSCFDALSFVILPKQTCLQSVRKKNPRARTGTLQKNAVKPHLYSKSYSVSDLKHGINMSVVHNFIFIQDSLKWIYSCRCSCTVSQLSGKQGYRNFEIQIGPLDR